MFMFGILDQSGRDPWQRVEPHGRSRLGMFFASSCSSRLCPDCVVPKVHYSTSILSRELGSRVADKA